MRKELIKKKILSVIRGQKLICLATITNRNPWARLVVSHNIGFVLYVSSYKSSRKVKEIKNNPNVHVVVAKNMESMKTDYVQIAGCAKVRSDKTIREKFWYPYMTKYYSSIDDPEYVVIEIKPKYFEYWGSEFSEPIIFKPRRSINDRF